MDVRIIWVLFLFGISNALHAQHSFFNRLADSAKTLTEVQVAYDPRYVVLNYPNGDVPWNTGVCSDVVIRAYRKLGVDLQKEVHEDMKIHFKEYPKNWGLTRPDRNIDHRRVPNLMAFFSRKGKVLEKSLNASHYEPGDIVCWNLGGGITHIGVVSNVKNAEGNRYLIIHNIGAGQVLEDCLFRYAIIGHYRYGRK
jgi:uncharacterized protein